MHLFLVVFEEAVASEAKEQAESTLLSNQIFLLAENTLLIQAPTSDPSLLTQMLGLFAEATEPKIGVIFKLNGTYSGYHRSNLWDWLKEARDPSD